jgi:hypothetical protein
MEKIMFKLPFGTLPAHWGLAGQTREIAQAEYELTGHALAVRLLEIKKEDFTELEYKKKLLDIHLKHQVITDKHYKRSMAELIVDEKQKKLATLELDYQDGLVTQLEYEKEQATIKGEPWVNMVGMDFSKKSSLEGSFEIDWNDAFVEKLKSEGYQGPTPDSIVNQWFMELCRNVAMEEFDGTGNFAADSEANLEAMKRWQGPSETYPEGRKGYK